MTIAKSFPGVAALLQEQDPSAIELGKQTILIFGEAGSGKTSVAAQFPNHMYLDLEGSATNHKIQKLPLVSWAQISDFVQHVVDGADLDGRTTFIVDTVSDLYELCRRHVLAEKGLKAEPADDYGKTTRAIRDEFQRVFNGLMLLHKQGRMGTVLIAHEQVAENKTPLATITTVMPKVTDKEIRSFISAKPQIVLRTFVTQTNPTNGEWWDKARFLTQAKADIEGAVVKDRTNRLPAFFPTSYEKLAGLYNNDNKDEEA